tara:strand:- start:285 stop:446 length:162 start_codon:yes stop_codon:yes gene_type:complete
MIEEIKKLTCTTRQKHILQIIYEYKEGWRDEKSLEDDLGKLFLDKRHKPKNGA